MPDQPNVLYIPSPDAMLQRALSRFQSQGRQLSATELQLVEETVHSAYSDARLQSIQKLVAVAYEIVKTTPGKAELLLEMGLHNAETNNALPDPLTPAESREQVEDEAQAALVSAQAARARPRPDVAFGNPNAHHPSMREPIPDDEDERFDDEEEDNESYADLNDEVDGEDNDEEYDDEVNQDEEHDEDEDLR